MKLKNIDKLLLTKEDIENKNELDKQIHEIFDKVYEYKEKLMNENTEKLGKEKLEELYKSKDKYIELIRIYRNCDKVSECIIIGIGASLAGLFSLFNSPLIGQLEPTLMIGGVTIFGLSTLYIGIKQLITRRKIKKNFKEVETNYEQV